MLLLPVIAAVFAVFPLTDTDIWWHLACAREWVTTWTPVREPVVNVHEYFQQVVYAVYGAAGAQGLVFFKALLWGTVFALFMNPFSDSRRNVSMAGICVAALLLFLFRYQFEMRPIVFSLLFLGIYWNVIPWLAMGYDDRKKRWLAAIGILCLQWIWCRCQGLYILGPIFALATIVVYFDRNNLDRLALLALFVLALFGMPFLHRDGLLLAVYPFELLNRLVGLSPSATIFAKEIAENRSPLTLLLEGENVWTSLLMIVCSLAGLAYAIKCFVGMFKSKALRNEDSLLKLVVLCATAILALLAERNFVLYLPVFLCFLGNVKLWNAPVLAKPAVKLVAVMVVMFVLGLWLRSLQAYDGSMVSFQRVPVRAAQWMKENPHKGRLFNDDRAGGYLAFVNPQDSTYIDGRFILKTADFFDQYLHLAENLDAFTRYTDSAGVDRVILPLRYYARWDKVINNLQVAELMVEPHSRGTWQIVYRDDYYVVFDRK